MNYQPSNKWPPIQVATLEPASLQKTCRQLKEAVERLQRSNSSLPTGKSSGGGGGGGSFDDAAIGVPVYLLGIASAGQYVRHPMYKVPPFDPTNVEHQRQAITTDDAAFAAAIAAAPTSGPATVTVPYIDRLYSVPGGSLSMGQKRISWVLDDGVGFNNGNAIELIKLNAPVVWPRKISMPGFGVKDDNCAFSIFAGGRSAISDNEAGISGYPNLQAQAVGRERGRAGTFVRVTDAGQIPVNGAGVASHTTISLPASTVLASELRAGMIIDAPGVHSPEGAEKRIYTTRLVAWEASGSYATSLTIEGWYRRNDAGTAAQQELPSADPNRSGSTDRIVINPLTKIWGEHMQVFLQKTDVEDYEYTSGSFSEYSVFNNTGNPFLESDDNGADYLRERYLHFFGINLGIDGTGGGTAYNARGASGSVRWQYGFRVNAAEVGFHMDDAAINAGKIGLRTRQARYGGPTTTVLSESWTGAAYDRNVAISGQNPNLHLGRANSPSTPFILLHSSGHNNSYDVRLRASGGTNGAAGQGTLAIDAVNVALPSYAGIEWYNSDNTVMARIDGSSIIAATTPTYASRAAAAATTVPSEVDVIEVLHAGRSFRYCRDAAGTALTTAGGAKWSPVGTPYFEHWGAWGNDGANDTAAMQAAINGSTEIHGFASSIYRVHAALKVPSNRVIQMNWATLRRKFVGDFFFENATARTTWSNTNISILNLKTRDDGVNRGGGFLMIGVTGLTIDGFDYQVTVPWDTGANNFGCNAMQVNATDVRVKNVRLDCWLGATWADGLHFTGLRNGVISDVYARTGDDCLAFHPAPQTFPISGPDVLNENIVVTNCYLTSQMANGIRIGAWEAGVFSASGPNGSWKNMTFSNIVIGPVNTGIQMFDSRTILTEPNSDIQFDNIVMAEADRVRFIAVTGSNDVLDDDNASWRNYNNITFSNITAREAGDGQIAYISGVENVRLIDCDFSTGVTAGIAIQLYACGSVEMVNTKLRNSGTNYMIRTLNVERLVITNPDSEDTTTFGFLDFHRSTLFDTSLLISGGRIVTANRGVVQSGADTGDVAELSIIGTYFPVPAVTRLNFFDVDTMVFLPATPIAGTVSQTSGVPTGSIIERGSNSNGSYVRFADGTQMCWSGSPFTAVDLTSGSGADGTWTYPAVFSVGPVITAVARAGSTPQAVARGLRAVVVRASGGDALTTALVGLWNDGPVTLTSSHAELFAIGRWY